MPSELEKLEQRIKELFEDMRTDMEHRYLTKADAEENFVRWNRFVWIIGLLMTIVIGLLGSIYWNQLAQNKVLSDTRENVASLTPLADFVKGLIQETN